MRFACAFPQSALPAASWFWPRSVLTSLPPDSQMMVWPFHLGQHCNVTHSVNWKLISSLNTSDLSPLCLPPPLASDANRALYKKGQKSKCLDGSYLQYLLPVLWILKYRTQPVPYVICLRYSGVWFDSDNSKILKNILISKNKYIFWYDIMKPYFFSFHMIFQRNLFCFFVQTKKISCKFLPRSFILL